MKLNLSIIIIYIFISLNTLFALENKILTKDLIKEGDSHYKTSEVGDWITKKIQN